MQILLKVFIFLAGVVLAYLSIYLLHTDKCSSDARTREPSLFTSYDSPQHEIHQHEIHQNEIHQHKSRKSRSLLGYMSYSEAEKQQFVALVARNATADDPELVDFVKRIIDPPRFTKLIKMSRPLIITPQAKEIDSLLLGKKEGFFVEAGALDGERSSNSIHFEVNKNWTGLLVEPDPFFYTQLIGKNRNSWSINACLSLTSFVAEMSFKESTGGHGKIISDSSNMNVPCFPLKTLLLAINVKTIDFLSLDIEGYELEVLKTIPFNEIKVQSLAVEYLHGNKNDYKTYMLSKGYKMAKDIHSHHPDIALYVDDFIFIKD